MTQPRPDPVATTSIALFVRRPILAFVLNALIVLAGLAALAGIEVRELPDVDRPVITISTDFSGAAPETVEREVTSVVEGAASRVAGVRSVSSSSRFGTSRVTVELSDDVDLDVAATDIRDLISRVQNSLPEGADLPRVVKADANSNAVMRIAVTSPNRSPQELTGFVEDIVEDRLLAATGVADVQIYGQRSEVIQIDVDQRQLASRGLTLSDLRAVLADLSFDAPAGSLSSTSQSMVVRTTATVSSPEQIEALVIRENVSIGDIAHVTFGPQTRTSVMRANGETGIGIGIIRQAQSNTLQISAAVRRVVDEVGPLLPQDVRIFVTSDDATFIRAAIVEVVKSLVASVAIVVVIIFLFLRDARATFIPAVAIPVALVGTIAALYLAGFSLNILTLLAMVLATGLVVDDAIVVLENIVRLRAAGMGARAAAVLGTKQVFFAVIATTTTLAAVFIPLSFLPGQTGGLFREFGFAMALAVLISSFVSLSLCPVLASRMLRHESTAGSSGDRAPAGMMARLDRRLATAYAATLRAALAAPALVVVVALCLAATSVFLFQDIKREVTPLEDRSVVMLSIQTPQGVALDYTTAKIREIEALIAPLQQAGEIRNMFVFAGQGNQSNRGFMVLALADWSERARNQDEIADEINERLDSVIGVQAYAIQPNSLGIRGGGQGLSFALVGQDYEVLAEQGRTLVAAMEENPAFGTVRLGYDTTQPQLFVEVDRARAADLGVNIEGMGEALQAVLDGRAVGALFIGGRSIDIKLVSATEPVNDPGDLERVFVRAGDGQMIPISTFVALDERAVAPERNREAQMRSVPVSAGLTPGLPLGQAMAELRALAGEVLPPEAVILPLGEAATLDEASSALMLTFGFAIIIVFLVLSAQFESFVSALIVMATVPLGLACAVFALLLTGGSLNVYSQIGLVLLVGIIAKNGILIVEFANQLRDAGAGVREAVERATLLRLRPVLMTMASTILGGVPLLLSSGAGAEARAVLGWLIVGGLGLAALATLYLTPVAYLLLAGLSRPRSAEGWLLDSELDVAAREMNLLREGR